MSQDKTPEDLPELPDDLPDLPDDALLHAEPAPTSTATSASEPPTPGPGPKAAPASPPATPPLEVEPDRGAAPAPAIADGERPPLRELDKAPTHLRKAALIAGAGTLLPFMGTGEGWWFSLGAKGIALVAAWLWLQQVYHDYGPKQKGLIGQLASLRLVPKKKEDDDTKRKSARRSQEKAMKIEHPWTAVHVLSLLLLAASTIVAWQDPRSGLAPGLAELGMFAWAGFTWVHIASYERWGGFNPLFPLMFLAMLFAGAARALFGATRMGEAGMQVLPSLVGGVIVAVGGGLAAFTIVEAMMEAKKEGDRKKKEASEARRAARKKAR